MRIIDPADSEYQGYCSTTTLVNLKSAFIPEVINYKLEERP
jgi:hypothetical protein